MLRHHSYRHTFTPAPNLKFLQAFIAMNKCERWRSHHAKHTLLPDGPNQHLREPAPQVPHIQSGLVSL